MWHHRSPFALALALSLSALPAAAQVEVTVHGGLHTGAHPGARQGLEQAERPRGARSLPGEATTAGTTYVEVPEYLSAHAPTLHSRFLFPSSAARHRSLGSFLRYLVQLPTRQSRVLNLLSSPLHATSPQPPSLLFVFALLLTCSQISRSHSSSIPSNLFKASLPRCIFSCMRVCNFMMSKYSFMSAHRFPSAT